MSEWLRIGDSWHRAMKRERTMTREVYLRTLRSSWLMRIGIPRRDWPEDDGTEDGA